MSWKKYFRRGRRDADFERELEAHLEHETDGFIEAGMNPEAARHAALRKIGNVASLRERVHEGNSLVWLEGCLRDLRYAIRQLRLSPGFTAVAILSLALGAGLNTAIFQLLDAVRLRSLPAPHPERLAELSTAKPRKRTGNFTGWPSEFTNAMWEQIRERQQGFSGVAAWSMDRINLSTSGEARFAQGMWVSGDFFHVLGVEPVLGRAFTGAEDNRQCNTGVVIGYSFWQREFGGDPAVLARSVTVNTVRFPILGVAPESFFGVEPGRRFDVALPLCAERIADSGSGRIDSGTDYWLGIMGRLRDGWRLEKARAQLSAISPQVFGTTLPERPKGDSATNYLALRITANPASTGESEMRSDQLDPLWLLLGASAMVLVIGCANLASIALARASAREREIAVRLAIGASRGRIVRQLLVESLLVSVLGCGAGLFAGGLLSRALTHFLGDDVFLDLTIDWRVALFTAGIAVGACLLFGLAPGLRSTRMARSLAQAAGGRISGGTREGIATRRLLAVIQMSLSLVLVAGALLSIGLLRSLVTRDPGFRVDGVAIVMADVSGAHMQRAQHAQYYLEMLRRMEASKRVAAAAAVGVVPIGGGTWNSPVAIEDGAGRTVETETYLNSVTGGFFGAMRVPLLAGRNFAATDDMHARKVAIVDQTFVKTFLHGESPLGKVFRRTGSFASGEFEIVGVCANSKYANLREAIHPTAYINAAQDPEWDTEAAFVVRANGPIGNAAEAARQAARELEPRPLLYIRTLQGNIDNSLRQQRLFAALSGLYGILAALLAAIGVYGALSYSVARRRNEIGVRMALGASRGAVIGMVLRETSALAVAGVAIGAGLTVAVTRAAASAISGMESLGLPALAIACVALGAIALVASFVPARRAAGIDPAAALRQE